MKRPSPALAISILALFVALGGTSYAVTQLARNSVGTAQLKKNAVTGAKVKDGSLSGADVDVATLGTVPAATSANRANSAQSAERAASAGSADSATTAGTAARANTAGTADSAATAGSAATAADAGMLNGKTAAELIQESKLRCPAGTKLAAGACIDEQTRAEATLYGAFQICAEENRRLPTQGEMIAYVFQYTPVTEEWIEPEIFDNGGGVYITATKEEYGLYPADRAFPRSYRCATAASN